MCGGSLFFVLLLLQKLLNMHEKHLFLNLIYKEHPLFQDINQAILANKKISLTNINASAETMLLNALFVQNNRTYFTVLPDRETAAYFYSDLQQLVNSPDDVLFFPSSYKKSATRGLNPRIDKPAIIARTESLNAIESKEPKIVVSYPDALLEKVMSSSDLESNTLMLFKDEKISIDFITEVLITYGFERVDFVFEPGQFAVRGSIVDIFSFANDDPYRIDFFGDEIDSIRSFDINTQLSKNKLNKIAIIPDIQHKTDANNKVSVFEFLPQNTILWFNGARYIFEKVNNILENSNIENDKLNFELCDVHDLELKIHHFGMVETAKPLLNYQIDAFFEFKITPQIGFNKNFELLGQHINRFKDEGYKTFILSDQKGQLERIKEISQSHELKNKFRFQDVNFTVSGGFFDDDLKICCYTDHQIFERYHKYKLKTSSVEKGQASLNLRELNQLKLGDYVVHTDHGIGKFAGIQTIETNNKKQETIRLVYQNGDSLFVSIHALHKISKYKGEDAQEVKVHKLGSAKWRNLKARTKSKIKDIAEDLIKLYAKRLQEKGTSFSEDSYLQTALEASFIYEDTPDQNKATLDVKADMEAITPMDRLVCGDVGFGKTEIAIRAAFKAVADNKQVAVLVPTTILAFQHFKTFSDRLKDFPATVQYISRMRTAKEVRQIKEELASGRIDIIIGTHRLVGKDIQFKDLGLMIIDEEQKFGVSIKEKLKQLKVNIDTLTLTATPIPRTLQFSLMGARDLSVINTPPPNRFPIVTEVHRFDDTLIADAIRFEVDRGGQVFFIHNRVQNILEVQKHLNKIVPETRTVVAHGQMEGKNLEKIMLDFIDNQYDVLIATTIIESGLDIPNANTIIINNAHHFGLSDLHQLRGRVGRSNKKAYCYLLAPELSALPSQGRRRLNAIENFSELGSGLNIAMQDLDIRGAGNLLGGEQSGFINDIGYETYQQILNEAIQELRENEYRAVLTTQPEKSQIDIQSDKFKYVTDCNIDTDMELLIPDDYVSNMSERIKLYRDLDRINDVRQLEKFRSELIDRFGAIPSQTEDLLQVIPLRLSAIDMGMEKINLKNSKMSCHFVANSESLFYKSKTFMQIIQFTLKHPQNCRFRERNDKQWLEFDNVNDVAQALSLLEAIKQNNNN